MNPRLNSGKELGKVSSQPVEMRPPRGEAVLVLVAVVEGCEEGEGGGEGGEGFLEVGEVFVFGGLVGGGGGVFGGLLVGGGGGGF